MMGSSGSVDENRQSRGSVLPRGAAWHTCSPFPVEGDECSEMLPIGSTNVKRTDTDGEFYLFGFEVRNVMDFKRRHEF
jgi:hypothetical protein